MKAVLFGLGILLAAAAPFLSQSNSDGTGLCVVHTSPELELRQLWLEGESSLNSSEEGSASFLSGNTLLTVKQDRMNDKVQSQTQPDNHPQAHTRHALPAARNTQPSSKPRCAAGLGVKLQQPCCGGGRGAQGRIHRSVPRGEIREMDLAPPHRPEGSRGSKQRNTHRGSTHV